jgi:hypothetical protein
MIVSYNFYYAKPGNAAAVLQQRIKASDVRAQLGLPRGRIISKVKGEGDWPDVIWRLDFADMATQNADMKARADSPEFEAIRQGMRQLYRRFERPLYAPRQNQSLRSFAAAETQTLFLHGLYCDTKTSAAAQEALRGNVGALQLTTDQKNIPQLLVETTDGRMPEALQRLPLRMERSLWRIEDCS